MMRLPTAVEPVNEIMSTRGSPVSTSPTVAGSPDVTTLSTPAGMSVSSATSLPMHVALHGVSGAGFRIDRVAGRERGHELRQVEHEREVPRRDRADDADRLAHDQPVRLRIPKNSCDREVVLPLVRGRCSSMSHSMSSMQLSCCTAYVSTIGAPTSATICGRSVSRSLVERLLQLAQARACAAPGSSTSRSRRTPGGPRRSRAPCRRRRVGDLADDLFGRRVDVVVGRPRTRLDELRRRSASGLAGRSSSATPPPLDAAQATVEPASAATARVDTLVACACAIAALDLGSNSFHLARRRRAPRRHASSRRPREGDAAARRRRQPRGHDHARGRRRARSRRCAASGCSPRRPGATEILASATSALRTARNGDEVLDRIEAEAGVEVDVIRRARGGAADLRARSAPRVADRPGARALLRPRRRQRRDHGRRRRPACVGGERAPRRRPAHRRVRALRPALEGRPAPAPRAPRRRARPASPSRSRAFEPKMAIGSSGTLEDLAHMIAAAARRVGPALAQPARVLARRVRRAPRASSSCRPASRAPQDRRASTPSGSSSSSPASSSWPPRWSCSRSTSSRSATGRCARASCSTPSAATTPTTGPTTRARSGARRCMALARRCSWPEAHSRHVAGSRSSCSTRLRELHGLDDDDRELLEYAALLHDIGEHVAHEGHDRHAAYLVAPRPAPRASTPRSRVPHRARALAPPRRAEGDDDLVGELDDDQRDRVRRLAALLRIADGLDRSRKQVVDRRRRARQPVARAAPTPRPRRSRARALGRAPQARAVREGLRPRARAHRPPRGRLTSERALGYSRDGAVDDPRGRLDDVGA